MLRPVQQKHRCFHQKQKSFEWQFATSCNTKGCSVTLSGKDLVDKVLTNNWSTEFVERIQNNPKTQKGIERNVGQYSNDSYKTQY